jgi:polyferredoxin
MGLASVDAENRRLRTAYLLAWLLVLAYFVMVWAGYFIDRVDHQLLGA